MADTLKSAFEKAGVLPAAVSFSAACHDLARLALNREPDPVSAAGVWLGMAHQRSFKEALVEFLRFVAAEGRTQAVGKPDLTERLPVATKPVIAAGEDRPPHVSLDHELDVSPAAVSVSGGGDDLHIVGAEGALSLHVTSPPDPVSTAGDDPPAGVSMDRKKPVTPAVDTAKVAAATEARRITVAAQSGFFITDRQGGQLLVDDIHVDSIPRYERMLDRRSGQSLAELYLLRALKEKLPAFAPSGHRVRDCFGLDEIRAAGEAARERAAFMVSMQGTRQIEASA